MEAIACAIRTRAYKGVPAKIEWGGASGELAYEPAKGQYGDDL